MMRHKKIILGQIWLFELVYLYFQTHFATKVCVCFPTFWIFYFQLHARSDTERLQVLTEKQAKEITENKLYIKELEDRERILAQNVITYMIKK